MVGFANGLVAHWPRTHRLAYVHYPLAEAADPPPLDASYYAPLGKIRLPSGVRFVAGFVHEKRTIDEHRQILAIIDGLQQHPVDVACSCGLGRRSTDVAGKLLDLTARVVSL